MADRKRTDIQKEISSVKANIEQLQGELVSAQDEEKKMVEVMSGGGYPADLVTVRTKKAILEEALGLARQKQAALSSEISSLDRAEVAGRGMEAAGEMRRKAAELEGKLIELNNVAGDFLDFINSNQQAMETVSQDLGSERSKMANIYIELSRSLFETWKALQQQKWNRDGAAGRGPEPIILGGSVAGFGKVPMPVLPKPRMS